MNNLGIFLFIICGFLCKSNCQKHVRKCPQVTTIESFDLDKYMGTWYMNSINYNGVKKRCHQVVYKNEGNDTVAVAYTEVSKRTNRTHSSIGTAKVMKPGELAVSFRKKTYNTANYIILGTDYDKWAVVYSCINKTLISHSKLFIFTRERQVSDETLADAKQIIEKNKFDFSSMKETSQQNCPFISNPFENDKQNTEASSTSITTESQSTTESLVTLSELLMDNA